MDESQFNPKVTPPDERPYVAGALRNSVAQLGGRKLLASVADLELAQRQFDDSEGENEEAAERVTVLHNAIWEAIVVRTTPSERKPRGRSTKGVDFNPERMLPADQEAGISDEINRDA